MRAGNDEGPTVAAATPQETNQTTDAAIVVHAHADRKQLATLAAEAALQGREVIALPDGRMLLCRWDWCRVCRNLRDMARALDKGWLA